MCEIYGSGVTLNAVGCSGPLWLRLGDECRSPKGGRWSVFSVIPPISKGRIAGEAIDEHAMRRLRLEVGRPGSRLRAVLADGTLLSQRRT